MSRFLAFFRSGAGFAVVLIGLAFAAMYFIRSHREGKAREAAAAQRSTVNPSLLGQMTPESVPVDLEGSAPGQATVGSNRVVSYAPAPYKPPPPPPAPVQPARAAKPPPPPPPPPPVPKLVHTVSRPAEAPASYNFPRAFAPAGTLIPCYLSITVDSANFETPVVGKVEEPVFFNKRLIIPKGTEVHAVARQGRLRDRIAITGSWRLVWEDGKELLLSGIALDRRYDPAKDTYGITDGSAGIRGTVYKGDANEELKLLAASFASGLARASQQQTTNGFGQRTPDVTLGNSVRGGAAEVADRWADRILDDIITEGYYVRVPAGTQFYIYAVQTIEPGLASLGGLKQQRRAATSYDLARDSERERERRAQAQSEGEEGTDYDGAGGAPPADGDPRSMRAIIQQRDAQVQEARRYLESKAAQEREAARLRAISTGGQPEQPALPDQRPPTSAERRRENQNGGQP